MSKPKFIAKDVSQDSRLCALFFTSFNIHFEKHAKTK